MKLEDYEQYYIENSEHYLIHKDAFKELFDEMVSWKNDYEQLQKENEELKHWKELHSGLILAKQSIELFNRQKEFIKYLEDESKEIYRDGGLRKNIFRQILQKYEEIIGNDNSGIMDKKSR